MNRDQEEVGRRGAGAGVSLEVDREVCASTGYCSRFAPDLFELGPSIGGQAAARITALSTEDQVSRAVEAQGLCPLGAILVEGLSD
ncbi:ferredoxin [Actinomadura sp. LOL_016]|uniref:ferredoxin n=1 Tax=unclassified Actinomadura TaxID=2626254 RepID=UPI003A80C3B3